MSTFTSFLGSGLIRPFQRDIKGDFANAKGAKLIEAQIGQTLATRAESSFSQGELPWQTAAGSLLYTLRHRNNDEITREKARLYSQQALRRWNPRIELIEVEIIEPERLGELNKLVLRIRWRITTRNRPDNLVFLQPQTTEVTIF